MTSTPPLGKQPSPHRLITATKATATAALVCAGVSNAWAAPRDGIAFECTAARNAAPIERQFASWGIPQAWLQKTSTKRGWVFQIKPDLAATSTLEIARETRFGVTADTIELLDPHRDTKLVPTVSKKEIALALLHPGRLTRFTGRDCGLEALRDDVGVRQTTVAWTQNIAFGWPNGGPASWNAMYWTKGTPARTTSLHEALTDAVINPSKYEIGCYTAAKILLAAGSLDYFTRIKRDPAKARTVEAALWSDGDPLVDIEPGRAWYFESDYEPTRDKIRGKILDMQEGVSASSFVPGDWIYLLNPDPVSYQKTGYEGSNAIYLGLGKFSDYYKDHEFSFNLKQKLHEVYQWRHGVFSRSRDADKVHPLTAEDFNRLALTPQQGGLLLPHRLVPRPVQPVRD